LRFSVAREGIPIIASVLIFSVLLLIVYLITGWGLFNWLWWIGIILAAFSVYFFRDPARDVPGDPAQIVSPADGTVVLIDKVDDPFAGANATRISIFLTVFNVHINRVPCSGSVVNSAYKPGRFLAAFDDRTSEENEQTIIDIRNSRFDLRMKQIAGLIARRIINYLKPGDTVRIGERFGLIRFGSRVDVIFPEAVEVLVQRKAKVTGGETILGVWNEV